MCRDYILVGSDSGRIVILEYIKDGNYFKKIHQETFGKSGCRRIVPGQYMAADPKGRACMIGGPSCLDVNEDHARSAAWSATNFCPSVILHKADLRSFCKQEQWRSRRWCMS